MRKIAYLTTDEVNEDLAIRLAEERGAAVVPFTPREPPPNGDFDAVLYDIDHLPERQREHILIHLLDEARRGPVAIHSFNLEETQALALSRKGVGIFRSLGPATIQAILARVEQRAAEYAP